MRVEESPKYLLVGHIGERDAVEVVALHELVEYVCTQHNGLRDSHRHALKSVEVLVALYYVVEESEAAALAAERPLADACEVAERVEALTVEDSHHALVLHPAVGYDGVVYNLAVLVDILERLPCYSLQELGYREQGARAEPARYIVVCDMVEQGLTRQCEDIVLQLLEVVYADERLHCLRIPEYEVAESELVEDALAEVMVERF